MPRHGASRFPIAENTSEFLAKAEVLYGRFKAEEFGQFMWDQCSGIESPIEQMFFIALHVVSEVNLVQLSICAEFNELSDDLIVIPQWRAGKYHVDFALRQHPIDKIVCVELDGHSFHDRDERQRRYEKMRDRFLTVSGYSVLHFTGYEVVKDPYAGALEAFKLVTNSAQYAIHPGDENA